MIIVDLSQIYVRAAELCLIPNENGNFPHSCSAINSIVFQDHDKMPTPMMALRYLISVAKVAEGYYADYFTPTNYQPYEAWFGYPTKTNAKDRYLALMFMAEIAKQEQLTATIS